MLDVFTPQNSIEDFNDIYFVMEHMDRTLEAVIQPKLNDHRKISFLTYQLLCGVNYLHKANIIHRVKFIKILKIHLAIKLVF